MNIIPFLYTQTLPQLVDVVNAYLAEKAANNNAVVSPLANNEITAILEGGLTQYVASAPDIYRLLDLHFSHNKTFELDKLSEIVVKGGGDNIALHYLFAHGAYFTRQWYNHSAIHLKNLLGAYLDRRDDVPVPKLLQQSLANHLTRPMPDTLSSNTLQAILHSGVDWMDSEFRETICSALKERCRNMTDLSLLRLALNSFAAYVKREPGFAAADIAFANEQLHYDIAAVQVPTVGSAKSFLLATTCGNAAIQKIARQRLRDAIHSGSFESVKTPLSQSWSTPVADLPLLQEILKEDPAWFDGDTADLSSAKPSGKSFLALLKTRALGPQVAAQRATTETEFKAVMKAFPLISEPELLAMSSPKLKRSRTRNYAAGMAF